MDNKYEKKFRVWLIEDKNTYDQIRGFENQLGKGSTKFFCTLSYSESVKFAEFLNTFIIKKKKKGFENFIPDYVIVDLSLPETNDSEQGLHKDKNIDYLTKDIYENHYDPFTVDRKLDRKPDFEDNEFKNGGIYAYSLMFSLYHLKKFKGSILSGHQGPVNSYGFLVNAGFIEGSFFKSGSIREKKKAEIDQTEYNKKELKEKIKNILLNQYDNESYREYIKGLWIEEGNTKIVGYENIVNSEYFKRKKFRKLDEFDKKISFKTDSVQTGHHGDADSKMKGMDTVFYQSFINFREKEINKLDFGAFNKYLRYFREADRRSLGEQKIYSRDGKYFFLAKNLFAYEFNKYKDFEELIPAIEKLTPPIDLSIDFSETYNNKIIRYFTHEPGDKELDAETQAGEEARRKLIHSMKRYFEGLRKKLKNLNIDIIENEIFKLDNLINTINNDPPTFIFKKPGGKTKGEEFNRYKTLIHEIDDYIKTGKRKRLNSLEYLRKQCLLPKFGETFCPVEKGVFKNNAKCGSGRNQYTTPGKKFKTLNTYLNSICDHLADFYREVGDDIIISSKDCAPTYIFFNFFWAFRENIKKMIERERSVSVGMANKHYLVFRNDDSQKNNKFRKNYICFISDGNPFDMDRAEDNDISDGFIKSKLDYFGDFFIISATKENCWKGRSIFSKGKERELECDFILSEFLLKVMENIDREDKSFESRKAFVFKFISIKEEK